MNAVLNWASAMPSALSGFNSRRTRRLLLAWVGVLGLVIAGVLALHKPGPSPALLAERVAVSHHPEPSSQPSPLQLSSPKPVPATQPIALPLSLPPQPDPLLREHSQKLAVLDKVITEIRGDMAGMANRLDGFQNDLQGIKQLAQHPVIVKTVMPHHPSSFRHRAKVAKDNTIILPGLALVAINHWGNESRLIVKQQNANAYQQLRIGDPLAGGTISAMNGRKIVIKTDKGLATVNLSPGSRL
jgi:hypothetical protein